MNPDTKLTREQLRAICARHGIRYRFHERMTTGFSHEVHRLNDNLVIKLYNTADSQRFVTESAMLALDAPIKKPALVAKGRKDDVIDRDYVVMTHVPGFSLGSRWHMANDDQREGLIKDIALSLRAINAIEPSAIGLAQLQTWQQYVVGRSDSLLAELLAKGILGRSTVEVTRAFFAESMSVFADAELRPVYWDIHFDNFIVDADFQLQALIDLENVELTALEYPLFVVEKQMSEPEKYLSQADEQFADKADYHNLKRWYKQYCPELFTVADLDIRLKAYALLDTLHLLIDWPQVRSLYDKLNRLIG